MSHFVSILKWVTILFVFRRRLTFTGMNLMSYSPEINFGSESSLAFSFDGLTKPSKKEKQDDIDEVAATSLIIVI